MPDRVEIARRVELRLTVRTVAIWTCAAVLLGVLAVVVLVVAFAMWDVADGRINHRPIVPAFCRGAVGSLTPTQVAACDNARDLEKVGFSTAVTAATVVFALAGAAMTAWASATRARGEAIRLAAHIAADHWVDAGRVVRLVVGPFLRSVGVDAQVVHVPPDKVLPE